MCGPCRLSSPLGYNPAVSQTLSALVQALDADPTVRLGVLFGSAARQRAHTTSDLDVGVLGPDPEHLSRLHVTLARATGRTVEVIALDRAPSLLRFEVARDGQVLVERAPHLWSDFKTRAMVDWWDWAPLARRFHAAAAARLREEAARGSS